MRKRIYQFYNLLASYPVLLLLVIGIAVMVYIAGSYQPLELLQLTKLEAHIQLKQKRQGLEKELVGVEMIDLAKRYALFNQNFLERSELDGELLSDRIGSTLEAYGWSLDRLDEVFIDDDADGDYVKINDEGVRIEGVIIEIEASSISQDETRSEPFLPLYSTTQALRFMWARPPTKEYQRIKLSRLEEGYLLEASIFMPLRDAASSSELKAEEAI